MSKKIKGFFDAITLEEIKSRERGTIRLPTVSVKQLKSDMYKTLVPLNKEARRARKNTEGKNTEGISPVKKSISEPHIKTVPPKEIIQALARTAPDCASCGLCKEVKSPKIVPYGKFKKGIFVLGEAPGEEEDRSGAPWQGRAGQRLQLLFKKYGLNLFEDCVCLNAVNCRPTEAGAKNRPPSAAEVNFCRPYVISTILKYQPKVLFLLGGVALNSLLSILWGQEDLSISRWHGWTIPDQTLKAWIAPLYHPSYIERQQWLPEVQTLWESEFVAAVQYLSAPFPEETNNEEKVDIVETLEQAISVLKKIKDEAVFLAFDLETTGLKPFANGHKIICISFCYSKNKSYVMPFFRESPEFLALLKEILESTEIKKIAANMKYEDAWLDALCGIDVQSWIWDTMLAAHILDNRIGVCSLKFQTYVTFGVANYSTEVAPFLTTQEDDANAINSIEKLLEVKEGKEKLYRYCGLDSLFTYRLAFTQMRQFSVSPRELVAYD